MKYEYDSRSGVDCTVERASFSRRVIGYISDALAIRPREKSSTSFSCWVIGDIGDASCSSFNLVNPDRFQSLGDR